MAAAAVVEGGDASAAVLAVVVEGQGREGVSLHAHRVVRQPWRPPVNHTCITEGLCSGSYSRQSQWWASRTGKGACCRETPLVSHLRSIPHVRYPMIDPIRLEIRNSAELHFMHSTCPLWAVVPLWRPLSNRQLAVALLAVGPKSSLQSQGRADLVVRVVVSYNQNKNATRLFQNNSMKRLCSLSYRGRSEKGSQSNLSAWANDSDFDDDDQFNDVGGTVGDVGDYVLQPKPRIGRPSKNPGKASALSLRYCPCNMSLALRTESVEGSFRT